MATLDAYLPLYKAILAVRSHELFHLKSRRPFVRHAENLVQFRICHTRNIEQQMGTHSPNVYQSSSRFLLSSKIVVQTEPLSLRSGSLQKQHAPRRCGLADLPFCSSGPVCKTAKHIIRDYPNHHLGNTSDLTSLDEFAIHWLQRLDEDLNYKLSHTQEEQHTADVVFEIFLIIIIRDV